MIKASGREKAYQICITAIVVLLALVTVFPLYYTVLNSITPQADLAKRVVVLYPLNITFSAYETVLRDTRLLNSFFISVWRTVIGTALTLAFTSVGAYVVSRKNLPFRKFFIFMIMVTILFGGGLVPSFVVVMNLGLLNSFWSMIIPGLVDSWGLLVIKQYFENIPESMEEAAFTDGATEMQYFLRIALPTSGPVLAAIGLFNAVGHWNSWFDALIYISDGTKIPMQLLLRNMLQGLTNLTNMSLQSGGSSMFMMYVSPESLKMAMVVIATVPILCVYPFLQKHFTKGVFLGAVKG